MCQPAGKISSSLIFPMLLFWAVPPFWITSPVLCVGLNFLQPSPAQLEVLFPCSPATLSGCIHGAQPPLRLNVVLLGYAITAHLHTQKGAQRDDGRSRSSDNTQPSFSHPIPSHPIPCVLRHEAHHHESVLEEHLLGWGVWCLGVWGLLWDMWCIHMACVQVATGNTSLVQSSSPTSLGLLDPTW